MRLIDADALCVHIEEEFDGVCVYDVSGNEAAREFCDMVDIAPTIDAIPMWWITEKFLDVLNKDKELSKAVWLVCKAWQKEHEAR